MFFDNNSSWWTKNKKKFLSLFVLLSLWLCCVVVDHSAHSNCVWCTDIEYTRFSVKLPNVIHTETDRQTDIKNVYTMRTFCEKTEEHKNYVSTKLKIEISG